MCKEAGSGILRMYTIGVARQARVSLQCLAARMAELCAQVCSHAGNTWYFGSCLTKTNCRSEQNSSAECGSL